MQKGLGWFKKTRDDFRVFLHYFKKYRSYYLIGIISLVIVDSLEVVPPLLLKTVIDGVSDKSVTMDLLAKVVAAYMAVALVQAFMRYLWRQYIIRTSMFASHDMRSELFTHISTLSPGFFRKRRVGDLVSLSTNDIEAMRFALGPGALILVDASFYFLTIPPMMYYLSPKLTLIAFIPMLAVPFFVRKMEEIIEREYTVVQEKFSALTSHCQEALSGVRLVKGSALERFKEREFSGLGDHYIEANVKAAKTQALVSSGFEVFVTLSTVAIFLVGGAYVIGEKITLGVFVAFHKYIQKMSWPMEAFGLAVNIFQRSIASQKRVDEVLQEKAQLVSGPLNITSFPKVPTLSVRNLHFAFPNTTQPALNGISFDLEPGKRLGLAGRVGSGKSALLHCISRRESVGRGNIFLNDIDIVDLPLETVRATVGVVTQDTFLFSRSVEDNILYGSSWFHEKDKVGRRAMAERFARAAQVHEDIMRLPDAYETRLGERGVNISGGQRQRISIARALALDPKILLLDDCLSAVDSETERALIQSLKTATREMSVLIVSHRLSSFDDLDAVMMLHEGRILEQGAPSEMREKSNWYRSLSKEASKAKEMELLK